MKILVTGANGQLGRELRTQLEVAMPGITDYTDIDNLDVCDAHAVDRYIAQGNYTHIINCAAFTAVDRAESEVEASTALNVTAVKNLAQSAAQHGVRMVHISTDYVFDGNHYRPYTENDAPAPLSQYGKSKLAGEQTAQQYLPDVIIVRTAWLYSPYGHNFVRTIIEAAKGGKKLNVVDDCMGTPTYAADLAKTITTIITQPWQGGIYNFTNEGVASWYDFAHAILELTRHKDVSITPVHSCDYPSVAPRPYYSVLDKNKIKTTYSLPIDHWRDALGRCLARM